MRSAVRPFVAGVRIQGPGGVMRSHRLSLFCAMALAWGCQGAPRAAEETPIPKAIQSLGHAHFPNEEFLAYHVPGFGGDGDRAFIERSRREGPSPMARQIAEYLARGNEGKRIPLVIGGESSSKTKQVLSDALSLTPGELMCDRILFLGHPDDVPEVRAAVESHGGKFLFAEFDGAAAAGASAGGYPLRFKTFDITQGGLMFLPDGSVSLAMTIRNTSPSTLWVTATFETPDPSQRGEIAKTLAPGEVQQFLHAQASIAENAEYWFTATAYGDAGRTDRLESHRLPFRF